MKDDALEGLLDAIEKSGVKVSFSRWCVSGLVPEYAERCECWRCRDKRGEPHDEDLAERVSRAATEKFYEDTREFLRRNMK